MSIRNLYPKARPQSIYNVINGRQELPAASTFSRASEAAYFDANGIIQTAAVDEPRFNHDPETGEFLGLYLEEGTTNYAWGTDLADGSVIGSSMVRDIVSGISTPAGITDCSRLTSNPTQNSVWRIGSASGFNSNAITFSAWFKAVGTESFTVIIELNDRFAKSFPITTEWTRLVYSGGYRNDATTYRFVDVTGNSSTLPFYIWGSQIELCEDSQQPPTTDIFPTSYIRNTDDTPLASVTRAPDAFSLTSSSNFDGGFSLLLDSETTTDDYFYKIKASGTTIAELNNASGTLDWVVNGTSAATNGEYPQVGAIQPGRVRTISSFGAADGTTQVNYLYTEGLSFPTNAIVASGANEVEFAPGQTLKAVYLWNGQLSNTEAVSVIKGEYNVVPNEPIKADSYSFVYNTDPENIGETSITLPYIVPTVSMRVYWGDGTDSSYEQGVTPSHTYPYPGQYRIQIEADDGFDAARLGGTLYPNVITRVDQWAPQFRVGASGPGFTGDQLYFILQNQKALGGTIPAFKYTDLTTLGSAFANCTGQVTAINLSPWEYIPTNIPLVTSLSSAFSALGRYNNEPSPDRTNFPTLTTSSALTNVSSAFANTKLPNFVNDRPFTDTSAVTNWKSCFSGCSLTNLVVDTSAATSLIGAFGRNEFVTSPSIDASSCTDFTGVMAQNTPLTTQLAWDTSSGLNFTTAWDRCSSLTSFPQIDTSSGTDFTSTWESCSGLTSFPSLDYSSATTIRQTWKGCETMTTWGAPTTTDSFSQVSSFVATWQDCLLLQNMPLINTSGIPENGDLGMDSVWQNCAALTSFPLLDTSNCKTLQTCWSGCGSLTSFPAIDTSSCKEFTYSWRSCPGLTSFPLLDFSAAEVLSNTWVSCSGLTSFPQIDTSSVTNVGATWRYCSALTAFPLLDFSSAEQCYRAWDGCTLLEDFPANSFDSTGTLESYAFEQAWQNCALTANSIENILVSLDTNGASNITLGIDGGTNAGQSTWTAAANTAYTNLINKGWTISSNP